MQNGEPSPDDTVVVRPVRARRRSRVIPAVVVGAVVVGLVVALPWLRSNVPSAAGQGDWPGQFTRCGEPTTDVMKVPDGVERVDVTLLGAAAGVGVHEAWTAAVTASSTDATAQGWVYGTDLSLVRDGVVVAVQDGPQVPLPQEVAQWPGDYPVDPLPLVSDVSLGLASCDPYLRRNELAGGGARHPTTSSCRRPSGCCPTAARSRVDGGSPSRS